jgi:hypothetical protein
MPFSLRRQCPECAHGIGVARTAVVLQDRPSVFMVTLACQTCLHEWYVEYEVPSGSSNPAEKRES